ncbi:AsnC family transcriptional regulator [Gilliamella sp. B3464]|uniref:Lrp/AsnC family transcriptional regulator n=1 Tax=unclassified Gilliamella TaxID=2685620 RepID=UPI0022699D0E|nr:MULTISPECIES: AsnC family transcriptional regulator [unclassified Gilliamella]MCX8711989.1 AsnC family transcriptional regulator [Gilliamella sp. B3468]MCX8751466.1 AsnC family transcriptional regulator [Gilliamella sp. B3464]
MDKKDRAILNELKNNSRQSWKEIGEKIYLSGQAVGQRVVELQIKGIIEKFTIKEKTKHLQFITIYMNTNQFESFEQLIKSYCEIIEFYKITGDGCYFIKSCFDRQTLTTFLEKIEYFCRYKVSHQLKNIL